MKKWTISRIEDFKLYIGDKVFSRLDSLTGAYSQAVFFRDFKKDNLYKYNYYIDLDNFKTINEKLGPIKASMCLSYYVEELKAGLNKYSFRLYRFGGDEFILSSRDKVNLTLFKQIYKFEKLHVSASAVSLNIGFHDRISLEEELSKGQLGLKRAKKIKRKDQRNKNYDLFVG